MRNAILWVAALAFCLLCRRTAPAQDARCGAYCLYVGMKALGLNPETYAELERRLGEPLTGGYTLEQIDAVARSCGAKTIGVQTTLDNLQARPESFACITLVGDHHFVLLYKANDEQVWICDPPKVYEMPRDTFRATWSGKALLIGPKDFLPEEEITARRARIAAIKRLGVGSAVVAAFGAGAFWIVRLTRRRRGAMAATVVAIGLAGPGCSVEDSSGPIAKPVAAAPARLIALKADQDLGVVILDRPGQTMEVAAEVRNVGSKPIRVRSLVPSCACTDVRIDPVRIAPGERAVVSATIRLIDNDDDGGTRILIHTDDPDAKPAEVRFTWKGRNRLHAASTALVLPSVRSGRGVEHDEPITMRKLGLCPACRFEVEAAEDSLNLTFEPAPGLPRSGHADLAVGDGAEAGKLRLTAPASIAERHYKASAILRLRCGDQERARLALPVSWQVVPAIGAAPRRLFLGTTRPGERLARTVILSAIGGESFRVTAIEAGTGGPFVRAAPAVEPRPLHPVELELTLPERSGAWTSDLVIVTDSPEQPRIVIPMAGVVEG